MRRLNAVGLVLLACTFVLLLHPVAAQAQPAPLKPEVVAGKYQGTASGTPDGDVTIKADLKVEKGIITGIIDSPHGPMAITTSSIKGDQVTLNVDMGGAPGTISGTYKDGRVEGTWTLGEATGKFLMTKITEGAAPAGAADKPAGGAEKPAAASGDPISGVWDGVTGTEEMARNFTLTLKVAGDKVTGEIASDEGAIPLASGSWKEGALVISFDFAGMGTITMAGGLKEGKLVGTLDLAGQMQMPWAAVKRINP